jgi:hypothetical protein
VYAKLVYSIRIDDDGTTAQAQVKDIIANTNVTGLNVTLVNNTGDPFADFRGITDPTGAWIDITSKQHLAVEFKRVSGTGYVHLQGSSHVVLKYSNI